MKIRIKKGKTIPIKGQYQDTLSTFKQSRFVSLNLASFDNLRFSLLKKVGEKVSIGEPVACDRKKESRLFVAPASGTIREVIRGEKRRILDIVIELDGENHYFSYKPQSMEQSSKEDLLALWSQCGILSKIRRRPCSIIVEPEQLPKSIFIKAIDTAPFAVSPHHEAQHFKPEFLAGLEALKKLMIPIHLVSNGQHDIFQNHEGIHCHEFLGPHPAGNASTHIYYIDPIYDLHDIRWVLTVHDVISMGHVLLHGHIHHKKIISAAGEGIEPSQRKLYMVNEGVKIDELLSISEGFRTISGDPLTGRTIQNNGFLGAEDFTLCAIEEAPEKRKWLHFFRLGIKNFTLTNTYLSAFRSYHSGFPFDTNQHGEVRAFVDTEIYDRVFPLKIPVVLLIKALIAKDYEKAMKLGLLEIASEDFALPTFICPSKIDMVSIAKQGLKELAEQYI